MREGWQVKPLGELCKVANGGTPKTDTPSYWEGSGIAWITPAEMGKLTSPYVGGTRRNITQLGLQNSSATILPINSVILSSRAPIGHLVINSVAMATNQGCKGLIPDKKIHYKYLYYFLLTNVDLLNSLGSGTTFKELSGPKLKEVKMPFPSYSEQQRIVGILDITFSYIDIAKKNTEKCLENSDHFNEIFFESAPAFPHNDWRETSLGEIAEFRNGINYTKSSAGFRVKIVGVREFKNRYWVPTDELEYITSDAALNSQDELKKGDIVLVRSNGNPELIGRSMIAGEISEPIVHSGFTIRARLTDHAAVPEYICHYLKRRSIRTQLTSGGTGLNIKSLNQGSLSSLKIILPPPSEQASLVAKLKTYNRLADAHRASVVRKLVAFDELKQSILAKALSGELVGKS